MALITPPATGIAHIDWTLPEAATFVVRSGWTGQQTVGDLGGIRAGFKAKVALAAGKAARQPWGGFYAQLRGVANTFRLPVQSQAACPAISLTMVGDGRRVNLLTYSNAFADTSWTKVGATVAAGVADPIGGTAAFVLAENSAAGQHEIYHAVTMTAGAVCTFSAYAQAGGRGWLNLRVGPTGDASAFYNLVAGTLGTVSGTGSPAATITDVGNGWFRCSLTFIASGSDTTVEIAVATGNGGASYTGNGVSVAPIWAAQFEVAPTASSYIDTQGAAVIGLDGFIVGGTTPGVTYLGAGQLVTMRNRLFVLTADIVGGLGYQANVSISPNLPAATSPGEVAYTRAPYCLMRMTTPTLGWSDGLANVYTPFAFDAEEAL
jgi:hypothetical protein